MTKLEHLELPRIEIDQPRRTRPYFPPLRDRDPVLHVTRLEAETNAAVEVARALEGFDQRFLLTIEASGVNPSDLEKFEGFSVVSQQNKKLTLLFANEAGLKSFKKRLGRIKDGENVGPRDIVFAIDRIGTWTASDRKGPALRAEGEPPSSSERFLLDVELWPLELTYEVEAMLKAFEIWCQECSIFVHDKLVRTSVVLLRVECESKGYEALLEHRDVRGVDYPPRYAISERAQDASMNEIGEVTPAPVDAPIIAILDSGINRGHPLLSPAVSNAESFLEGKGPEDEHGHGTAVAGLAAYHDVHEAAASTTFVPMVRIHGARVVDQSGKAAGTMLENIVIKVVEKLVPQGIRIFNLSISDVRKPYTGGHVAGLARVLDELSRKHDILFVVPSGNYEGVENPPQWQADYPRYLLDRLDARILDPAPALNVLTVGSLARHERPLTTSSNDVRVRPVARRGQPSPFSRTGPGSIGAIKPDVAEFGGNYVTNLAQSANRPLSAGVGELSLHHDPTGGLLIDRIGTSFATPKVAHVAARVLAARPDASMNLVRALVVGSAAVPPGTGPLPLDEEETLRLVGYGQPSIERACHSDGCRVTLIAETEIGENKTQFFEVPLVASFLRRGLRERVITVSLAHCPAVRSTRADYRASRFDFRLVASDSLDNLTGIFRKTKREERQKLPSELRSPSPNQTARGSGTVQRARYAFMRPAGLETKRLYVVVTRTVPAWAAGLADTERYSLVVTLEDQEAVTLYQEVRATLQGRIRARN